VTLDIVAWIVSNVITVGATIATAGIAVQLIHDDARLVARLTREQPGSSLLDMACWNLRLVRRLRNASISVTLLGLAMIEEGVRHLYHRWTVAPFVPLGTIAFSCIWLYVCVAVYSQHRGLRQIAEKAERERQGLR